MKTYKRIFLYLFLMIVVTGCVNVTTNVPLSSSTATNGETPSTPKPTEIPATPTETPDPNNPPGATGKDAQGNWIKTENGVQVAWNAELNTWERHINVNNEGIPLVALTQQMQNNGGKDMLFLHAKVSDKVPGFEHIGSLSLHNGANVNIRESFGNQFWFDLLKKIGSNLDYQQILDGKVFISFTTSDGTQNWKISPDTKVEVYILDKPIGNGFQDWKDAKGNNFQSRMFTDEQGNLHLWIVPGRPIDQYSREELMEMYLFAPASVISDPDQRVPRYSSRLSGYVILATDPPYFDFGPPQ